MRWGDGLPCKPRLSSLRSLKLGGCSQAAALRAGERDVGASPGFTFLGAVGNCSRKTSHAFFTLSPLAFVLFQLLPLDLPSPQRVLVSMHPSSFFPPSLPPPSLHPWYMFMKSAAFQKHLFSVVVVGTPSPTHTPQRERQRLAVCLL